MALRCGPSPTSNGAAPTADASVDSGKDGSGPPPIADAGKMDARAPDAATAMNSPLCMWSQSETGALEPIPKTNLADIMASMNLALVEDCRTSGFITPFEENNTLDELNATSQVPWLEAFLGCADAKGTDVNFGLVPATFQQTVSTGDFDVIKATFLAVLAQPVEAEGAAGRFLPKSVRDQVAAKLETKRATYVFDNKKTLTHAACTDGGTGDGG
jgi:hypothetical protein